MKTYYLLVPFLLLLSGCAAMPADSSNMIPQTYNLNQRFNESISVEVKGGKKTNPLMTSEIAGEDFKQAVVKAIENSGVFSQVTEENVSGYRLAVEIRSVGAPAFGWDLKVSLLTAWQLTSRHSGKVVWKDVLYSTFTATRKDAFDGVKRLRLAKEGVARKNIQQGIEQLSALKL